jgi:hypothetical protein
MGEWCKGSMVERRPAVRASCCEAPTSPRSAHCNGSTGQDGSNGRAVSAGRGAAARLHLRAAAWRGPQTLVTAGGCEKIFKLANARRRRPQNAKPQRPQPGQGSLKPPAWARDPGQRRWSCGGLGPMLQVAGRGRGSSRRQRRKCRSRSSRRGPADSPPRRVLSNPASIGRSISHFRASIQCALYLRVECLA